MKLNPWPPPPNGLNPWKNGFPWPPCCCCSGSKGSSPLSNFCRISEMINITNYMLSADSADDKLMTFFLFFHENRIWPYMQTAVCMKCQNLFSGKIPKCRLLKILPSMQNAEGWYLSYFRCNKSQRWFTFCLHWLSQTIVLIIIFSVIFIKTTQIQYNPTFSKWGHNKCSDIQSFIKLFMLSIYCWTSMARTSLGP